MALHPVQCRLIVAQMTSCRLRPVNSIVAFYPLMVTLVCTGKVRSLCVACPLR